MDICAAIDALLPCDQGGLNVRSFHDAVLVPSVGVVIDLAFQDKETEKWSTGEVVAVPASKLGRPKAAIARFGRALLRLADPAVAARAMRGDLTGALGLESPEYEEDAFAPTAADEARRAAAARVIEGRFEAVAARLREVYGFRLPRHVGVFAAFVRGLSPVEERAFRAQGLSSAGILDWFEDGGLERAPVGGADLRLHWRFRRDPPELVTLLLGGMDGLHFGLWYDDPAELPSFIVENYARDDGVSKSRDCTTMIEHLEAFLEERAEVSGEAPSALDHALKAALAAMGDADAAALAADGPVRWASSQRPRSVTGVGPALPGGVVDALWPSYEYCSDRGARYELRALRVARYVREARAELAAGRPGPALLIGHELFWLDDTYDEEARDLLLGAYAALGRSALAEVLRVHLADRGRPTVDVYRA